MAPSSRSLLRASITTRSGGRTLFRGSLRPARWATRTAHAATKIGMLDVAHTWALGGGADASHRAEHAAR